MPPISSSFAHSPAQERLGPFRRFSSSKHPVYPTFILELTAPIPLCNGWSAPTSAHNSSSETEAPKHLAFSLQEPMNGVWGLVLPSYIPASR